MAHNSSSKKPSGRTQARTFIASEPLPVARTLLSAGIGFEPELEMARQQRMETLKGELIRMAAQGNMAGAIDQMMALFVSMERENDQLAWRVLRAYRYRFGSSTEKLSREELHQLYLAFGGDEPDAEGKPEPAVPAPEEPEQVDEGTAKDTDDAKEDGEGELPKTKKKKKRTRVRSMKVAPWVEQIVTEVPLSSAMKMEGISAKSRHGTGGAQCIKPIL